MKRTNHFFFLIAAALLTATTIGCVGAAEPDCFDDDSCDVENVARDEQSLAGKSRPGDINFKTGAPRATEEECVKQDNQEDCEELGCVWQGGGFDNCIKGL